MKVIELVNVWRGSFTAPNHGETVRLCILEETNKGSGVYKYVELFKGKYYNIPIKYKGAKIKELCIQQGKSCDDIYLEITLPANK